MQFIDEAIVEVHAGNGGNGCMSFRREKHRPLGGPSGGDGGHGGDIVFIADTNLSTLLDQRYKRHYTGNNGEHGRGKDQHGRGGSIMEVRLPVGTLIFDIESDRLLCDFETAGQQFIAAKGGRGGRGNINFITPSRQAPDYAEDGRGGELRKLRLELKLLADVGVIGFPNVGKSTFIAGISKAKPKIANYPFTTLTPNLGVIRAPGRNAFVMADVPGLIPGAHKGIGLGTRFLRHVERTSVFLHMLELAEDNTRDPLKDFEQILEELTLYDEMTGNELMKKPTVVALNKVEDLELQEICLKEYAPYFKKKGIPFFVISAITGEGVEPLLHFLTDIHEKLIFRREEEKKNSSNPPSDVWSPLG